MSTGTILVLVLTCIMIVIVIILTGVVIGDTFQMNLRNQSHLLLREMGRSQKMQRLGDLEFIQDKELKVLQTHVHGCSYVTYATDR